MPREALPAAVSLALVAQSWAPSCRENPENFEDPLPSVFFLYVPRMLGGENAQRR